MTSSYTLKVDLQGEIRRLKGWPAAGAEPAFAELQAVVCEAFGVPAGSLHLQYRDDEGDPCALEEVTLPDALSLVDASESTVLRLIASRKEPETSNGVAVPNTSVADRASEHGGAIPVESVPNVPPVASNDAPSECPSAAEESNQGEQQQSGCTVRQRLDQAKPRLSQGMQRFKSQIAEDYKTARKEMKGAFDPEHRRGSECPQPLRGVRGAVGVVAGVAVAGRLVPLRATRLAAEAYVAISNPGDSDAVTEPASSGAAPPLAEDTSPASSDATAAGQSVSDPSTAASTGVDGELVHFTQQVKQDFEVARQEIRDVFGCVMRSSSSQGVQADDQQQLQSQQQPRGVVPEVASAVAGVTVASTLVPVRAARLIVAAGRMAVAGAVGAVGINASNSGPSGTSSGTGDEEADDAPTGVEEEAARNVSGPLAVESTAQATFDNGAAADSA
eukprot:CAMPEP_0115692350 /NCGR_PEP_ID=MMETSP0272-20121206/63146_1 /TAXON_ID=71861 /ORGANISM="Scrippsiella trochoidea, Strain CCMP3099" /LENGTH=445 /DNA_ID=CAMNT_0003132397 /DNA_START=78 /DNA_END=1415 /DNA_ORIENTATION=-